jgi:transposase
MDKRAMELTLRRMRGTDTKQSSMLCLMSPESVVPEKHPLRRLKPLADEALANLSPTFDAMYSAVGRPSIPPERLLKATLLMALYTVRSERLFCEQLDYNLLFRWFLDMDMTELSFDHSTFSRNRERLLAHDVAKEFFGVVVQQARDEDLMSDEHFTVDGTLIEAWASLKSFRPKGEKKNKDDGNGPPNDPGNRWMDFHGEKRTNETHESKTDPEAKLMRKGLGKEAKLSYSAHALMENRYGLLVDFRIEEATGLAEREAALAMLDDALPGDKKITLGADKGYDTRDFVNDCRERNVVPHVAQNAHARRRSAIDARTTRHVGYSISQRLRKRVEEIFGWAKTTGNFRRTRYKGKARTQLAAYFVGAAYNLLRIAKLLAWRDQPLPEGA